MDARIICRKILLCLWTGKTTEYLADQYADAWLVCASLLIWTYRYLLLTWEPSSTFPCLGRFLRHPDYEVCLQLSGGIFETVTCLIVRLKRCFWVLKSDSLTSWLLNGQLLALGSRENHACRCYGCLLWWPRSLKAVPACLTWCHKQPLGLKSSGFLIVVCAGITCSASQNADFRAVWGIHNL